MPTSATPASPSSEDAQACAPSFLPAGWISTSERLPREEETMAGRVPVLDNDGFLVTGLLLPNNHLMDAGGPGVRAWLPVPAAGPAPTQAELARLYQTVAEVAAAMRAKALDNPDGIKASALVALAEELDAALQS